MGVFSLALKLLLSSIVSFILASLCCVLLSPIVGEDYSLIIATWVFLSTTFSLTLIFTGKTKYISKVFVSLTVVCWGFIAVDFALKQPTIAAIAGLSAAIALLAALGKLGVLLDAFNALLHGLTRVKKPVIRISLSASSFSQHDHQSNLYYKPVESATPSPTLESSAVEAISGLDLPSLEIFKAVLSEDVGLTKRQLERLLPQYSYKLILKHVKLLEELALVTVEERRIKHPRGMTTVHIVRPSPTINKHAALKLVEQRISELKRLIHDRNVNQ